MKKKSFGLFFDLFFKKLVLHSGYDIAVSVKKNKQYRFRQSLDKTKHLSVSQKWVKIMSCSPEDPKFLKTHTDTTAVTLIKLEEYPKLYKVLSESGWFNKRQQ